MAKSLRSSRKKTNKTILRARVHRPVEDARIERLSAKLLELASKPKDEIKVIDSDMAIDDEQGPAEGDIPEEARATSSDEKMDVDEAKVKKFVSKPRSNINKVQKKRRTKVIFAVGKKHGSRPSRTGHKGPGIR